MVRVLPSFATRCRSSSNSFGVSRTVRFFAETLRLSKSIAVSGETKFEDLSVPRAQFGPYPRREFLGSRTASP